MPNEEERDEEQKIAGVPEKENPGHSTKGMPDVTGDRTESERRVGSGNTRTGAIEAKNAAGETGE